MRGPNDDPPPSVVAPIAIRRRHAPKKGDARSATTESAIRSRRSGETLSVWPDVQPEHVHEYVVVAILYVVVTLLEGHEPSHDRQPCVWTCVLDM